MWFRQAVDNLVDNALRHRARRAGEGARRPAGRQPHRDRGGHGSRVRRGVSRRGLRAIHAGLRDPEGPARIGRAGAGRRGHDRPRPRRAGLGAEPCRRRRAGHHGHERGRHRGSAGFVRNGKPGRVPLRSVQFAHAAGEVGAFGGGRFQRDRRLIGRDRLRRGGPGGAAVPRGRCPGTPASAPAGRRR